MAIGLSEAAAATGVNRSTIYRAFKAGRLSATRTDTGQIEVEPAELFRVFPPIASQQGAHDAAPYGATDESTHKAFQDSALEHELQQLRDALAAMREDRDATRFDRDAWRDLARKEGDERRELAQRLALAAPTAAPGPVAPPEAPLTKGVPHPRRRIGHGRSRAFGRGRNMAFERPGRPNRFPVPSGRRKKR
jgi:hypothetical protein